MDQKPADLQQAIDICDEQHLADLVLIAELRDQLASGLDKIENLEVALATARRIGTAMGVLMERHHYTEDQAFTALRVASQHTHRKLRELAETVVLTGELPR